MIAQWSRQPEEFVKRTAFALLWSMSLHDKGSDEEPYFEGLRLIERESTDERHFVKKAVNMALRAVGRRTPALLAAAKETATRLATSSDRMAKWNGKHALRELAKR